MTNRETLFDDHRDSEDEQFVTAVDLCPHDPKDVRADCDCALCRLVASALRSFG